MKQAVIIIVFFMSNFLLKGQIGIDKSNNLGASSILEFGTQARGIRLQPVENVNSMSNAVAGTIVFDRSSGSLLYKDSTGWSSPKSGGITGGNSAAFNDNTTQGVIMGATSSSTSGVLILGKDSGETKALVLPNVGSPEFKMLNPPLGLILYDSDANVIKVWNGNVWTVF